MATERKFVRENIRRVLLKEYLMRETERAGFGGLEIQRTPMGTRVVLYCERPGFVIGRKGGAIKDLTAAIEHTFKFDNPQIEVQEVKNPALNAHIMAKKLAIALERGWQYRRAGHSTVRRIMDAGARGCQVIISGKLAGERHRTEKFREGMIKYCGDSALKFVEKGYAVAKLKPGIMGATVWIMRPDAKLPDEIKVKEPAATVAQSPVSAAETQAPATPEVQESIPQASPSSVEKTAAATRTDLQIKAEKIRVKPKLKRQIESELKSLKEGEVPPIEEDLIDVEAADEQPDSESKKETVEKKDEKHKEVN
ncbi:MAG: 30S ribosomal protein S3 [Thermoplasmata archaeon]|nr:30S ribosomal protein S3 [Thermoplasmata archaeon]